MKRELFENVKVIPGGVGVVVDRSGFLSAVLGVNMVATGTLKVKVEHSDEEEGEFTALTDPVAGVTGALKEIEAEAGTVVNVPIDLLGCKNFIKITVEEITSGSEAESTDGGDSGTETATVTYAVVLGDPALAPV